MWYYSVLLLIGLVGHVISENLEFQNIREEVNIFKRDVENQCTTKVCETATSKMLSFMDHSADPCDDFYEFVCGNQNSYVNSFSNENFQVIDKYLKKNVSIQSKKYLLDFQEFYRSCVDFDSSFNFVENMKFIKINSSTNLTEVFTELILTQSMPFFDVGINLNKEDASYIFQINLPGRSSLKTELKDWNVFNQVEEECEELLDNSMFTENVDLEEVYKDFEKCRESLMLKYAEKYQKDMQFALPQGQITDNKTLQNILNEQLESLEVVGDTDVITKMSINDLSQNYGVIDWKLLFEGLAIRTFTGDEIIEFHNPASLTKAFEFMNKFDERRLVQILQDFSSFQLYKNFFRVHKYKKHFCMDLAQELMPDIATMIQYEVKNSSSIQISHCKDLFNKMKKTLRSSLQNSSLEDELKKSFIAKLNGLELGFITSGDSSSTENNYKDVIVTKNYKENVLNLLKNYKKMLFSLVHTKSSAVTLLTYFVGPFSTSPKTFYASNYVDVATLGLPLAQEIAKHFDFVGRSFRTGVLSREGYYEVIRSNAIEVLENIHLISPIRFQGTYFEFWQMDATSAFKNEMVAINTAFITMVTDYLNHSKIRGLQDIQLPWISDDISTDQIFFIAAAQEFCGKYSKAQLLRDLHEKRRLPFPLKIRIIMSSSPTFSKAFSCSEWSTMNLETSSMVHFPYNEKLDNARVTNFR